MLHELEELLKEYNPVMSGSIEKPVDGAIRSGVVCAEIGCPTST